MIAIVRVTAWFLIVNIVCMLLLPSVGCSVQSPGSTEKERVVGHPQILEFKSNETGVKALAFSPDGSILASSHFDRVVRLWDVKKLRLIRVLSGHKGFVLSLSFCPTRTELASASEDGTVRIWNWKTGKGLRVLGKKDGACVRSVAYSLDGQFLASGGDSSIVTIWNVKTWKPARLFRGHEKEILSVTFSPDGKQIASGSADKSVKIWDLTTNEHSTLIHDRTLRVESVVFGAKGKIVFAGGSELNGGNVVGGVVLWDVATRKITGHSVIHSDMIKQVIRIQNRVNRFATISFDKSVKIWSAPTVKIMESIDIRSLGWCAAASPDGACLAVGTNQNRISLWKIGK